MTFRRLAPARDTRSQVHPSVAREMLRIYKNMGFTNGDDFDAFWSKINTDSEGKYIPFADQEDDPRKELITRALNGEQFDTKATYRKMGYNV